MAAISIRLRSRLFKSLATQGRSGFGGHAESSCPRRLHRPASPVAWSQRLAGGCWSLQQQQQHWRGFASSDTCAEPSPKRTAQNPTSNITVTDTPKAIFEREAHRVLHGLQDRLEEDDIFDRQPDLDVEYSDGILKVVMPGTGSWVLNQHGATRQIWLSSPISGPHKYNYHLELEGVWLGERDQHSLSQRLVQEWTQALELDQDLDLGSLRF